MKNKFVLGPKVRRVLERDAQYVSPSHTRLYPLAPERGKGCWIWDMDGRKYLDFAAGIAVCATGHSHPKIISAITRQAKKLVHFSEADFYLPLYAELAERLAKIAPMKGPNRVFLCSSGTESIEAAIKLARYRTKRTRMIAFHNAFHGRTLGSLSLTASKLWQQRGFGSLLAGVTHIPFTLAGVEHLEKVLFRTNVPPEEVAAIIFEPMQGEGGLLPAEPGLVPKLRQICDQHGIMLVADEVQTGMGRMGYLFGCEHLKVSPDIICLAKALGGGLPLGAIIAPARIMNWPAGAHTSTFGGNPVACAAALAFLDLLEGGLLDHSRKVSEYLWEGLKHMVQGHPHVGEVRGRGMMIGFTLVRNRRNFKPAADAVDAVLNRSFEKGLLLLGGGEGVVRLTPPLILTKKEADIGLGILKQVLSEVKVKESAQ